MAKLPRRTFLRGVGTTMALPLLEPMLPTQIASAATASDAPLRMAFLYIPNGAHMPAWTPQAEGTDFELPATLQPLAKVRDHLQVLTGLTHDKARANGDGPGDHARSSATFLTGAQAVKTDGEDIHVGQSVDQIAADHCGHLTRLRSLEIGCEYGKSAGGCDSGYSCAYSHNISWRSATTPAIKTVNPRHVFDRLFGEAQRSASATWHHDRQSVLDAVAHDARRLQRRLGRADQRKLDEYLESVRQVERELEGATVAADNDGALPRPAGVPQQYADHARLMSDLLVLALQTDSTRVATYMLANAGSNRAYPEIDVREGHHSLSHHQNDEQKQAAIAAINRFHVEQLAYLLERLRDTPEGDGTLLDHTMLVYGSGISDGNRHNHDDLPILLAGGRAAGFKTGRHVRFEDETPLMNLYLTMLQTTGVPVDRVGDSTGTLDALRHA